jgi:hypothetical protein
MIWTVLGAVCFLALVVIGVMQSVWWKSVTIAIVMLGAGVSLLGRPLFADFTMPGGFVLWVTLGAMGVTVLAVVVHSFHEESVTRRAVASALQGRAVTTHEEFARRFYTPTTGPIAARVRLLLAANLRCDLSGMIPSDDFEKWLHLFPGPDSAADAFFEELAIEFQLRRDCPWPERFGSFDALVRFVAEHAPAPKTP